MKKDDMEKNKTTDDSDYNFSNLIENIKVDLRIEMYSKHKKEDFPKFDVEEQLDELLLRVKKEESAKTKRLIKCSAIAACLIFVISFFTIMFTPDSPHAGDNDIFHQIRVLKDKLFVRSEPTQDNSALKEMNVPPDESELYTKNYKNYEELIKAENTSLYMPDYVPEGYTLKNIDYDYNQVSKIEHIITYYTNKNNEVLAIIQVDIDENEISTKGINTFVKSITINDIEVLLRKNENVLAAHFTFNDISFIIRGEISENEMIKIIEGLNISP